MTDLIELQKYINIPIVSPDRELKKRGPIGELNPKTSKVHVRYAFLVSAPCFVAIETSQARALMSCGPISTLLDQFLYNHTPAFCYYSKVLVLYIN